MDSCTECYLRRSHSLRKRVLALPSCSRETIPAHFNAMCVVNQPLEDGISERRIADRVMQARDSQLRGQDSRAHLIAVFADPPEVAASSITSTLTRLSRSRRLRKLPSARAIAKSRNTD